MTKRKEIYMKKILFAIALIITLGFTATAQNDGFFSNWDDYGNGLDRTGTGNDIGFVLPASHGNGLDTPSAPPRLRPAGAYSFRRRICIEEKT